MKDDQTPSETHETVTAHAQDHDIEGAAPVVAGLGDVAAPNDPEPPFSVFTRREKWALVVMVGMASFFRYAVSLGWCRWTKLTLVVGNLPQPNGLLHLLSCHPSHGPRLRDLDIVDEPYSYDVPGVSRNL